jgi:hypothetical protein
MEASMLLIDLTADRIKEIPGQSRSFQQPANERSGTRRCD